MPENPSTLSSLQLDLDLWYRIHVLLYDLSNIANDPSSIARLDSTTDVHYISEPYFTPLEADKIRTTIIQNPFAEEASDDETAENSTAEPAEKPTGHEQVTVEEAIHSKLAYFLDKRKSSGDARPCGPHDMIPVYTAVFSIDKEELKDERFVSRLRRSGLGTRTVQETPVEGGGGKWKGGKKRSKP